MHVANYTHRDSTHTHTNSYAHILFPCTSNRAKPKKILTVESIMVGILCKNTENKNKTNETEDAETYKKLTTIIITIK